MFYGIGCSCKKFNKMLKHLAISAKIILVVLLGITEISGYDVKNGPLLTKRRKYFCKKKIYYFSKIMSSIILFGM